ncbi:MAG: hypothetical protein HKN53_12090 [Maribacter sp.]|nr:hypothetical protein [Maribacter sp.]
MNRYLILTILILVFYLPSYISNDLLARLTDEDGIYENIGALLFLLTSLGFAALAAIPRLYPNKTRIGKYSERYYFLFFALLFFFAFGEEISWGQRIFNFLTPESIKEHNIQGEFNVHNLDVFYGKTMDGEDKTGLSALLNLSRMFYVFLIIYLLILPLLFKYNSAVRKLTKKMSLPVPNFLLGIIFCFNLQYENVLRWINSDLEVHGLVEIKEAAISLIVFALPLFWINFKNVKKKE